MLPHFRPQQLNFMPPSILYSLIILQSDVIQSFVLLKLLVNENKNSTDSFIYQTMWWAYEIETNNYYITLK